MANNDSTIATLRSNHDRLCGTYTRFHLLCPRCEFCVAVAREEVEPMACPVCGCEGTEVYMRKHGVR